jgi:hypothetical protein
MAPQPCSQKTGVLWITLLKNRTDQAAGRMAAGLGASAFAHAIEENPL